MCAEQEPINRLENNLADFLIDYQSSHFTDVRIYAYKYNNLKIYMSPLLVSKPHFFVKFGISEACFSIDTGIKLDGSLGPEEAMVQKWASRISVHRELEACWKDMIRRKQQKKIKSNRDNEYEVNEHPVNISAILRNQKKKAETARRQNEKWPRNLYKTVKKNKEDKGEGEE